MQQLYQQLTTLLLTHQQKFYRLAYSYCHNAETAMDMVQAAACKALENYTTVKKPQYLKTWFYRILINECLDYLRRSKRELAEDILPAPAKLRPASASGRPFVFISGHFRAAAGAENHSLAALL